MNVDSFYTKGYAHAVCEDYALSSPRGPNFSLQGTPFACLSDGCSTGKHTDIGARLLCHAYRKHKTFTMACVNAKNIIKEMDIDNDALLATLIVFCIYNNTIYVDMCGDGVIVSITHDDKIETIDVEYPKQTPFYPYYMSDKNRYKQWSNVTSNEVLVNGITRKHCNIYSYDYNMLKYKAIYAFSDGIKSFMRNKTECVPLETIVKSFLPITNTVGEFVKRRANKVLKNLAKDGVDHYDDFSMIGFVR